MLPQLSTAESLNVIVTSPHESLPVALPVAAGSVDSVHSTVTSAGADIDGGVVSLIVMIWISELALSQSSVAVQVLVIILVLPQVNSSESE